jgi:hypothetical protein
VCDCTASVIRTEARSPSLVSEIVSVIHLQSGTLNKIGDNDLRMLDHFQMGPNLVRGFACRPDLGLAVRTAALRLAARRSDARSSEQVVRFRRAAAEAARLLLDCSEGWTGQPTAVDGLHSPAFRARTGVEPTQ